MQPKPGLPAVGEGQDSQTLLQVIPLLLLLPLVYASYKPLLYPCCTPLQPFFPLRVSSADQFRINSARDPIPLNAVILGGV